MQTQTIPKPATPFTTNGETTLYDAKGDTVVPAKPTLMARLNEKGKEEFTITKAMFAVIGTLTGLVVLGVTCLVLFVGWARDDQSAREEVKRLNGVIETMEKNQGRLEQGQRDLNTKFDKLTELLQEQRVQTAKKEGYELKAAEGDHGGQ